MNGVELSTEAEADTYAVWEYISRSSIAAADRWMRDLYTAIHRLPLLPDAGTRRDESRPGLRSVPFKKRYLIFYLVTREGIVVTRIIPGARQLEALDFR